MWFLEFLKKHIVYRLGDKMYIKALSIQDWQYRTKRWYVRFLLYFALIIPALLANLRYVDKTVETYFEARERMLDEQGYQTSKYVEEKNPSKTFLWVAFWGFVFIFTFLFCFSPKEIEITEVVEEPAPAAKELIEEPAKKRYVKVAISEQVRHMRNTREKIREESKDFPWFRSFLKHECSGNFEVYLSYMYGIISTEPKLSDDDTLPTDEDMIVIMNVSRLLANDIVLSTLRDPEKRQILMKINNKEMRQIYRRYSARHKAYNKYVDKIGGTAKERQQMNIESHNLRAVTGR